MNTKSDKYHLFYTIVPSILIIWVLSYLQFKYILGYEAGLILYPLVVITELLKLKDENKYGIFEHLSNYLLLPISLMILAAGIYLFFNYYELVYERAFLYTDMDYIVGIFCIVIGLLLAFKVGGQFLCLMAAIMLTYAYAGRYLPGVWNHAGLDVKELIAISSIDITKGMFGSLWVTVMVYVIIFLLLASLIRSFGGFDLIVSLSKILVKRSIYFIPQSAVISSMCFGMISGSAPGNVAATGSFTIPLMKRFGIPLEQAGATEAVSSTGGQIMPPIMGIAAFLMISFTGFSYLKIMSAAIWSALIFYGSVSFSVYLISLRSLKKAFLEEQQTEDVRLLFIKAVPILISFLILISILSQGYSVPYAGIRAVGVFLICQLFLSFYLNKKQNSGLIFKNYFQKIIEGVAGGGRAASDIMIVLVPINIILGCMTGTALNIKIANYILFLSEENLFLVALFTALICIVFGCAVSTTATYIMVSLILAPGLEKVGVPILAAHFFIFYFSMLSNITPPVAMSTVVAARISKGSYIGTCIEGIKMSASLFLLPFIFILYPNLIMIDKYTILRFFILLVAFLGLSYMFYGQKLLYRFIFAVTAIFIVFRLPIYVDLLCAAVNIMVLFYEYIFKRKYLNRLKPEAASGEDIGVY